MIETRRLGLVVVVGKRLLSDNVVEKRKIKMGRIRL